MRWLVASVLVASVAHAGENGFQFRTVVDVGAALRLAPSPNASLQVGPLASLDLTAGGRIGRVSLYGGGEVQGSWLLTTTLGPSLRVGPLVGVSVYATRWAVLSLDAKIVFTVLGQDAAAVGGTFRWGFSSRPMVDTSSLRLSARSTRSACR